MVTETLNIIITVIILIISYLLGSIPFGLIIGKAIKGTDIRQYGSKNIGSTNAIRVLGKPTGFLVFACDVLKGMIGIGIVKILVACNVMPLLIPEILFGIAAILGHSFSIFLDFKGGKAVATSLGVVLMICPLAAILCLIAFYLTLKISGYVSLASTFATLTVFITTLVLFICGVPNADNFLTYFIAKQDLVVLILIGCVATLIIVKHRKNYKRLLNGTENSFKKKKAE